MATLDFNISEIMLPNNEKGIAIGLTGSIDATTNQQFEQELTDILTQGFKRIILVLQGIKYINSTGLGTIVKCVDIFREAGGDIKMVGIPTKVIALFEMLGLLALFETFDTTDDAIQSFASAEPEAPKRIQQEYPVQLKCHSCHSGVNIKAPGKYKCPKCGDYFSAQEDGTIESYAISKPNVIQMQVPCEAQYVESIKSMAVTSAKQFGAAEHILTPIASSVDEVFSFFIHPNSHNNNMAILIVTDENKCDIGFVSYSSTALNINDNDARLTTIKAYMDSVEIVKLPTRGNLLKMSKNFTAA